MHECLNLLEAEGQFLSAFLFGMISSAANGLKKGNCVWPGSDVLNAGEMNIVLQLASSFRTQKLIGCGTAT